jgi:hypothetical protein
MFRLSRNVEKWAGAVKVGDHRGSVDNLVVGQVDIPSHVTGNGGRNARMTGTGWVESPVGLLARDGGNPSPPMPSGSMVDYIYIFLLLL